jgi:Arc/MetJ-type ribon-helix-helix transcriptional regulator
MEPMKKTISATIDKSLADWIEQETKGKNFRNKSHLIETALIEFKEKQKKP